MRVTEGYTDLRWGQTLASKFNDVVDDVLWGSFKPRRGCATVWESRGC